MLGALTYRVQHSALAQQIARLVFRPRTAEIGEVVLVQRRVFILPTRSGLVFSVMLFLLLLASINYQLSLGFALTFLLAASAIVGILHTFRNLAHVRIQAGKAEPVFAGDWARFQLDLSNTHGYDRYAITLHATGQETSAQIDITANNRVTLELSLPTTQRGWLTLPRVELSTIFPLGLWRAWAYWYPAMRCLVYPAPEAELQPLPALRGGQSEGNSSPLAGQEDCSGVRPFVAGDPLRHMAWKAIARQADDTLLTKHFEGRGQISLWLDWFTLPSQLNTEQRLSRLTRWILGAEQTNAQYGLRLPGTEIAPGCGDAHRAACLRALALFDS
jgi:uncharacterized protein (DUF58 family)